MAKRIGIIGGISHESTIKYYEYILKKYYARNKNYHYPEIIIFSMDLKKIMEFQDKNDIDGYVHYLREGAKVLEKAGAEVIVIAANSPHSVFEIVEKMVSVPMISMVEVAAKEALKWNMKKLLLTGIKYTMQSSFYQDVFMKNGMEVITPSEEEQDEINKIVFNELVLGITKRETKDKFINMLNSYKVDGIILGSTELRLILNQEDTDVKILNTLVLHAQATLDFALAD